MNPTKIDKLINQLQSLKDDVIAMNNENANDKWKTIFANVEDSLLYCLMAVLSKHLHDIQKNGDNNE